LHVEDDRYRIASSRWPEKCLDVEQKTKLSLRPCSDTQDTTWTVFQNVQFGTSAITIMLDGDLVSPLYLTSIPASETSIDYDGVRLAEYSEEVRKSQYWYVSAITEDDRRQLSPAPPAVGTINLRPGDGAFGAFAQYLIDCVSRLKKEHNITVDYVSPVNEPQYPWKSNNCEGSPWSQAEIVSVARVLDAILIDASPIDPSTKVLVSESAQYKYAIDGDEPRNLMAGLTGHPKVAAVFAAHAYYSNGQDDYTMRKLRTDLLAKVRAAGQELWQTSYSMLEEPSTLEGLKGVSPILDIHIAVHLAKVILHDLAFADAASWCFWTAMGPERGDFPTRSLLIRLRTPGGSDSEAAWRSGDGGFPEPAKTLWALGHFSRFVRPGYVRVWHSATWADGFGAVAFVNAAGTELVEIYVNINKEGAILDRASLDASVGDRMYVGSSRFYYTDASHDMALIPDPASMGGFSILTVVSQLRYVGVAMG
jgi:hypothetical protein